MSGVLGYITSEPLYWSGNVKKNYLFLFICDVWGSSDISTLTIFVPIKSYSSWEGTDIGALFCIL